MEVAVTNKTRIQALYRIQRGFCFHCGVPMLPTPARKKKSGAYDSGWTREHVVPKSMGGGKAGNIVLACIKCNTMRGNQPPTSEMLSRCSQIWMRFKKSVT